MITNIMMTVIICHGLHLSAFDWDLQIWGDVQTQRMGRVPRAVLAALEFRAKAIFFGSGASREEKTGRVESQVIIDLLIERLDQLRKFKAIDRLVPRNFNLSSWVKRRIWIEDSSVNTVTELKNVINMVDAVLVGQSLEKLVLVSGPTHISRAIRDASVILKGSGVRIYGVPSDVPYYGSRGAEDVVIFEPPHRNNSLDKIRIDQVVGRIWEIPDRKKGTFVSELDQLLNKYDV